MPSYSPSQDDRLLGPTRWVSAVIVPVLIAAFVILYGFPHETMRLWGWTVRPSMSALVMGAGYLSGAYFFTRVATGRSWHRVGLGFVATTVFSSILLVTTMLHWDRFNHDHVSFWAWILLYASTPFLLPILWGRNRSTDPRQPGPRDTTIPRGLRTVVGIGGIIQLVVAAIMFVSPDSAARYWPWTLDAPNSRSLAAFVAFPAVTWLAFLFDSRWSSFRITQQTAVVGLVLITLGAVRSQDDFLTDAKFSLYLVGLGVALVLNAALYVSLERRARASTTDGSSDRTAHASG
jgi:hypothetical protein